jgi:hypothetical protein
MVSKRQSTAMWCGETEIPAASNLLIEATPESSWSAWAAGCGGSQIIDGNATVMTGGRR